MRQILISRYRHRVSPCGGLEPGANFVERHMVEAELKHPTRGSRFLTQLTDGRIVDAGLLADRWLGLVNDPAATTLENPDALTPEEARYCASKVNDLQRLRQLADAACKAGVRDAFQAQAALGGTA